MRVALFCLPAAAAAGGRDESASPRPRQLIDRLDFLSERYGKTPIGRRVDEGLGIASGLGKICLAYTQNVVLPHGARAAIAALDALGDPAQAAVAQALRKVASERHS